MRCASSRALARSLVKAQPWCIHTNLSIRRKKETRDPIGMRPGPGFAALSKTFFPNSVEAKTIFAMSAPTSTVLGKNDEPYLLGYDAVHLLARGKSAFRKASGCDLVTYAR